MGMSGMNGKVYYIDDRCPTSDCTEWSEPSGDAVCWHDEVTRFVITDRVQKKVYGHDKSHGWQDQCAGVRGVDISLDAVIRPGDELGIHAGLVVFLRLYPYGTVSSCNTPAAGWALIDSVSTTVDPETGLPVGYSISLSSKGPWTGLNGTAWGGFECQCQAG